MTPRRIDVSQNHAQRLAAEIRDERARASAIAMYTATYEHYADSAQIYTGTELASTVAHTAMLFLTAADRETDNPVPSIAPDCGCDGCVFYRLFADKSVPAIECEGS